ncbi:MAG: hypothetical protein INR62_06050 [Rhodospirillales bacterium]|nr:hypothetical protein [Acetobacter sp.]
MSTGRPQQGSTFASMALEVEVLVDDTLASRSAPAPAPTSTPTPTPTTWLRGRCGRRSSAREGIPAG